MVWHHMSFKYLYSFVLAQSSDYFLQVWSILIVYDLPSVFRNEHYVVLAHPFRMCQTACLVCHKISFHCSNRLDILFYHVWRFFGITFVTHPLSGWLSVSHFVLNLPKGTIEAAIKAWPTRRDSGFSITLYSSQALHLCPQMREYGIPLSRYAVFLKTVL